jgi:hypothetical protein
VELEMNNHSGQTVGSQFITMTEAYGLLKKERDALAARHEELERKFELMKEGYEEKFVGKCEDFNRLAARFDEAKRVQRLLANEREELEAEVQALRGAREETPRVSRLSCRLESKNVHLSYPLQLQLHKRELTLHEFLHRCPLPTLRQKLALALKLLDFALSLHSEKKRMPALRPKLLHLRFPSPDLAALELSLAPPPREVEEEGLIYSSPEVLLGFNETGSSHCWSIGAILDELLHGRVFYRKFEEILSHKGTACPTQTTTASATPATSSSPSSSTCSARTPASAPPSRLPATRSSSTPPTNHSDNHIFYWCWEAVRARGRGGRSGRERRAFFQISDGQRNSGFWKGAGRK